MKLSKRQEQFFNSLKRGTGEAYLIARDNPQIDFFEPLIQGLLHIFAYDGQSEGDRAAYIYQIFALCPQKDKIRRALLQGLASEQTDTWNLTHLFAIAQLFAQDGDKEVKQAIYDSFLSHPIAGSEWVGAEEIIALDGIDGLLFVAEKFGKYIEANPDNWQDDWFISLFQTENPEMAVMAFLENKAKENQHIRSYLDNIERTRQSQKAHKRPEIQYKNIVEEVLNSKPFISYKRRRNLSQAEIMQLAERLRDATDGSEIEKLLDIFACYPYPFESDIILSFAQAKKSGKNRISEYAVSALKHLKSPAIRAFALDKIQNDKNPINYLEILVSNYQSGDFQLLTRIAAKTKSPHKIEQLAGIYADIFQANKSAECKEPLQMLYRKMNCGIHRHSIVEILMENKVLSEEIRQEIAFDSYAPTRALRRPPFAGGAPYFA